MNVFIHPFGKLAFVAYFYCLYEFCILARRRRWVKETFEKSVNKATIENKELYVFGELPTIPSDGGPTIVHIKNPTPNSMSVFEDDRTKNSIIFENDFFAHVSDFKVAEERMEGMSPTDLFFCPREFYSIFAYIDFKRALKESNGPCRVFFFFPPWYNFVYKIANPLRGYNRLMCGLVCVMSTVFASLLNFG
jgi:hypothetical protein